MKFMLQSHQLWAISQNVGSFDQFSTYEEVLTKFNFMCNKREMIHVNTLKYILKASALCSTYGITHSSVRSE